MTIPSLTHEHRRLQAAYDRLVTKYNKVVEEFNGGKLVTYILVDRLGGRAEITQAEMVNADGTQLAVGIDPETGNWKFRCVKAEDVRRVFDSEGAEVIAPIEA